MPPRSISLLFAFISASLLVSCGGGASSLPPPSIFVAVSAAGTTNLGPGQTVQLSAVVTGTSNTAVTWNVGGVLGGNSSVGTISPSGFYTAPLAVPNPASVTISAVSQADPTRTGSITVTIIASLSVSILPGQVNVAVGQLTQFMATVIGSNNQNVNWSLSGSSCSAAACGIIGNTGTYTAPANVPTPSAMVTVKAVSQADTTKFATATATVTVAVSVSPNPVNTIFPGDPPTQFTATVTGNSNTAVTWQVNGVTGGSASSGLISATGSYTPPPLTPFPPAVTVSAVAQFDNTAGSVSVPIGAINQQSETAPIFLGTSGGNEKDLTSQACCSGTLGSLIVNHAGTTFYILSNDHVLGLSGAATSGDPVDEPGLVDTNCNTANLVATFTQGAPLQNGGVDAAIAQIVGGQVDPMGAILQLGNLSNGMPQPAPPANSVLAPAVNLPIAKSGRTTGLTCGSITSINATVQVDYSSTCGGPTSKTVTYTGQVVTGSNFTLPGDSGSLIVDAQTAQPVALLFAGDPSNASAVGNPIQQVLNAFPDSKGNPPTIVGGAQHPVTACPNSAAAAMAAQNVQAIPPPDVVTAVNTKERYVQQLMADPAVVGVGVGAGSAPGQAAIVVYVDRNKARRPIPPVLDGIPTRVIQGGRFVASDWDENSARRCSRKSQRALQPWILDGDALSVLP